MRRSTSIALGVLVLLVPLLVWLLLQDEGVGSGSAVFARPDAGTQAPTFGEGAAERGEPPSSEAAQPAKLATEAPEAAPASRRIVAGRTLRAADGTSLPGILLALPGEGDLVARSGEDGGFRFEEAPVGSRLLFESPRATRPVVVTLPDAVADVTDLEITVDSGWTQPGVVLDAGGAPLAGAEVALGLDQPGIPELMVWEEFLEAQDVERWLALATRTAADGSFRLQDLPYAFPNVQESWIPHAPDAQPLAAPDPATAQDFEELLDGEPKGRGAPLRLLVGARAEGWSKGVLSVSTPAGPVVAPPITFELQRGGALAGRVTDRHAEPLAGVRVGAVYVATEESAGHAPPGLNDVTGEDGHYRVDGVPPATYVLAARPVSGASRRERRLLPGVQVRAGETTEIDIVMGLLAVLEGVVVDGAGHPVADATVELRDRLTWPGGTGLGVSIFSQGTFRVFEQEGSPVTEITHDGDMAVTDEAGRFRIEPLGAGPRRLLVTKRRDPTLAWAIVDVLIDELQPPLPVTVTLPRALRLGGRVIDTAGDPLQDVIVSLAGSRWPYAQPEVLTDEDGRFALGVDVPGSYELEVLLDGYVGQRVGVELAGDRDDLVVALTRASALSVLVLDEVTLAPVTSYELQLVSDGGIILSTVHAADGAFRQELGGDGALTVRVAASGYRTASIEGVKPRDTAIEPLRVLLERE